MFSCIVDLLVCPEPIFDLFLSYPNSSGDLGGLGGHRHLKSEARGETGISPEFRSTWLLHREEKVPFPAIFCLFSCVWCKKEGRQIERSALNPGMRVIVLTQGGGRV